MKKRYLVGVREIRLRFYEVTAENEEEAKELVYQRGDSAEDCSFCEFSHELPCDTWSVEDKNEDVKRIS